MSQFQAILLQQKCSSIQYRDVPVSETWSLLFPSIALSLFLNCTYKLFLIFFLNIFIFFFFLILKKFFVHTNFWSWISDSGTRRQNLLAIEINPAVLHCCLRDRVPFHALLSPQLLPSPLPLTPVHSKGHIWVQGHHLKNDKCHEKHSHTPHTQRTCCSQSKFRILKIRKSSARALFLYNCTPNISRSADASVSVA